MHPKNNNNDAHKEPSPLRDPYLSGLTSPGSGARGGYSEELNAVMDEMSGTATSRRASIYNQLRL